MAKGKGKPCGATHIEASKVCRKSLAPNAQKALGEAVSKLKVERAPSVPGTLKKELEALAARDQQSINPKEKVKVKNKPDSLYGAWDKSLLEKHRDWMLKNAPADPKRDEHIKRIEEELKNRNRKSASPTEAGTMTKLWKLVDEVQEGAGPQSRAGRAQALGEEEGSLVRNKNTAASTNTKWHRQDAKDFDEDFKPTQTLGNKKYDWSESYAKGSKTLGEGSFGQVMKTKGPPPLAVKRGEVGKEEAALIERVGKADLGPKLVAGQVSVSKFAKPGETLHAGRLAMTIVPGRDLDGRKAEEKVGDTTVGDAFWKARADLHRLGIAHNDMHPGNVFVDEKGKGRFVDMGLAQANPKAALSEAMGAFEPRKELNIPTKVNTFGEPARGDWQVKRFKDMTGVRTKFPSDAPETYRKINSNKIDLENRMRKDGLSNEEIGQVMGEGIRNKDSVYKQGVWAKISDEQAKSYIDDLYRGV